MTEQIRLIVLHFETGCSEPSFSEAAGSNVYIIFSFLLGYVVKLLWQPQVILKRIALLDHTGSQTDSAFVHKREDFLCPDIFILPSSSLLPVLVVFKGGSDRCAALTDCDEVKNSGLLWCVCACVCDECSC